MLRRIRREGDLSQREPARALGICPTAVAQAGSGRRDLPVELLAVDLGTAPPPASPDRGASGSAAGAIMRHDHPQSTEPGR